MPQRFAARERFEFSNGAIGWRPGGPFDCLGPYAKVENCPIHGTDLRRTCYATGYADTWFSVPADCKVKGKRITGYLTVEDGAIEFRAHIRHYEALGIARVCAVCGEESGSTGSLAGLVHKHGPRDHEFTPR